jgi:hypothetical protein
MDAQEFLNLQKKQKQVQSEKDKLLGEIAASIDRIEKEFGASSVDEAKKVLSKLRAKWKNDKPEVERLKEEFETKYEERLDGTS